MHERASRRYSIAGREGGREGGRELQQYLRIAEGDISNYFPTWGLNNTSPVGIVINGVCTIHTVRARVGGRGGVHFDPPSYGGG